MLNVVDCTLREGDQTAGVAMRGAEKLAIALMMDAAGVDLADLGMPAVSADERAFLTAAAQQCQRMVVGASVRCRPEMVDLALACGVGAVFVICPISRLHLDRRLGLSRGGLLDALTACGRLARDAGVSLEVVAEDATRAERDDLWALLARADAVGASRVYIADTVGCLTPRRFADLVSDAITAVGPLGPAIGVHCHNDLGMATANTVAAIEAGSRWPTACINGLGERCGNADLGAVVAAATTLLGLRSAVDLSALPALSAAVAEAARSPVPAAWPLVGRNAFRHESGIHVDGMLKDPATYEAISPALVGRQRRMLIGKHSGRRHLAAVLSAHGHPLPAARLDDLRQAIQAAVLASPDPEGITEEAVLHIADRL